MDIYAKLQAFGHTLPEPPPLAGIYTPVRQAGTLLFVSGQGCTKKGVPVFSGKVGAERSIEEGQAAAKLCVLNALSVLHAYLGDLNRIKGLIKTLAFVASASGFNRQPEVANGASQLLCDLWDDEGVGARSAIAANELPGDITVEIEFIFELKPEASAKTA